MTGIRNVLESAPAVLSENTKSRDNAINAANKLIEAAEAHGMSDALDAQMNLFLAKVKKTSELMKERRKHFTQIVDALKKEFTSLEADVLRPIEQIVKQRDAYTTKKMDEQRVRETAAKIEQEKREEYIRVEAEINKGLQNMFEDTLKEHKSMILDIFNDLNLTTIQEASERISGLNSTFASIDIESVTGFRIAVKHLDEKEVSEIHALQKAELNDSMCARYTTEIESFKKELVEQIPSKLKELRNEENARMAAEAEAEEAEALRKKTLEESDEVERARLEAELLVMQKKAEAALLEAQGAAQKKAEREAEEQERIEKEAADAKTKAEEEADMKAVATQAAAFVDLQATLFDTRVEAKEGYEIIFTNPAANLLIIQFWFDKEGKKLPQEKINRMTFERAKRFCEAWTTKHGERINSNLIEYKETFKAK